MEEVIAFIVFSAVKVGMVFGLMLLVVAYLVLLERKVLAHMQVRLGPMRVGFHGLLQPIADGIKLFLKEDIFPTHANKFVYMFSPVVCMVPALITFAIIPFGDTFEIFGYTTDLVIADINVGILYVFAAASIGVYGLVLAGWSSNNKYSLLGGLRSAAQMISYELSMGLSLIGILMISETLSMTGIVEAQSKVWFIVLQPVGFIIYAISAVAETNRTPFDLPEAETELVAGYHTEYSSMKFGMFFLAEYANIITVSAIGVTCFLGGWHGPFLPPVVWFLIKLFCCIFCFIWLRATFPRFRYDQLMKFGWKFLLPIALINILVTGFVMVLLQK
ncbi:MAG: NADH-quinone oxidoreductase subunit NuoH [Candidatus Anammoxibacter sp.]